MEKGEEKKVAAATTAVQVLNILIIILNSLEKGFGNGFLLTKCFRRTAEALHVWVCSSITCLFKVAFKGKLLSVIMQPTLLSSLRFPLFQKEGFVVFLL